MSRGASLSGGRRRTRACPGMCCASRRACWRPNRCRTLRLPSRWGSRAKRSPHGKSASVRKDCKSLKRDRGRVGCGAFPPGAGGRGQAAGVRTVGRAGPARCRAGAALSWRGSPSSAGSAGRSWQSRFRGGCLRMRSARGTTAPGSLRATPSSPRTPAGCVTCMRAHWEGQPLEPDELRCAPMRRHHPSKRGSQAPRPAPSP